MNDSLINRRNDDNPQNSCSVYKNYIRHPLRVNDEYIALRNSAVILNGVCSYDILLTISFE